MTVLVVGGGIGGLSAALCLARQGIEVTVFEQAAQFNEAGAGIQLSPNSTRVLHHLGLESALQACAFVPEATQFRQWRTGRVIAERPLGDEVVARYKFPYYHIHRGDLLKVLVAAAQQNGKISLHRGAKITGFSQNDTQVQVTANGVVYQGEALVGADGIHSVVRSTLWGKQQPSFTGNLAWRALVPTARLPKGLIRPMSTVWWGPGKHFVHYYVRGGEFVNCVCVVEKTGWDVESWTELGDYHELKADFYGWHHDVQQLIDNADRNSLFKWALYDRPSMPKWGKGRSTLLGDACHPTLPFMAQGAAMAIEDGAVLAACLGQRGDRVEQLQCYEQLRLERTASIQRGSRRNARIFHLSGVAAWFRNRAANGAGAKSMDALFSYNALDPKLRP